MSATPTDTADYAPTYPYGLEWDFNAILSAAGGAAKLRQALRQAGLPVPNPHTAWMWRQRNRIPSNWLPSVLWVVVVLQGIPLHDIMREADHRPESPGPAGGRLFHAT